MRKCRWHACPCCIGHQPIEFSSDGPKKIQRPNPFALRLAKLKKKIQHGEPSTPSGDGHTQQELGMGAWHDSYLQEQRQSKRVRSKPSAGRIVRSNAVESRSHNPSGINADSPNPSGRLPYKWLPQQKANGTPVLCIWPKFGHNGLATRIL